MPATETVPSSEIQAPPKFVQMEPVGQCNLRCRMCPIQFRRDGPPYGPPAYMDFDVFTRLLDELPELEELHLQGLGEPTIHPRFFDMVSHAVSRGIKVSTNSNMTLLTPERARRMVTSGLQDLHVSVDGATARTYEHIRVGARFHRVIRNLILVRRAKAELGSETPHLRMVVVAMRQNLSEFPELVRLAFRLGIRKVFAQHLCHDFAESSLPEHYRPMRDFVQEETLLEESPERIEHYFGASRALARKLGVDLRLPSTRPIEHSAEESGRDRCDWPWRGMYISYQGFAMPCCMVATPDRIHFGSAAEEGLLKVWNGSAYRDFRERLDGGEPPEICRTCSVYNHIF